MKNKLPRKKKKAIRDCIITYDVNSIPKLGFNVGGDSPFIQVMEYFKNSGVLLYSSLSYNGNQADKPQIFPKRLRSKIQLVDKAKKL